MKKRFYKWFALSSTSLGLLLSIMTGTALLIALPDIASGLNASLNILIWVLMSYMLATTVLVPSIGRVADMIGRKKLFIWGVGIFTVASFLAGASQNGTELLLSRLVQSIGGSLIIANSIAIVTDAFPKNQLGMALGINGMLIAVGAAIGPVVGGLLTVAEGWRWIFYMNVPLGILVFILAVLWLKDVSKMPRGQKFDFLGAATFTSGMFFLLYGLTEGAIESWSSPVVIGSFILSAVLIPLFIFIESRVKQPMLDLKLFRTRARSFAYLSNFLNGIMRGALIFLMIFYLLGIKGMNPFQASVYLIPFAVAMMIASPISGRLADKYGSRFLRSLGLFIAGLGFLGLAIFVRVDMTIAEIILWGAIVGLGSGIFNSPNTKAIMADVSPERRGIAAGTRTMMNNAGSVISIALAFVIISSGLTQQAINSLFVGEQVGGKGIDIGIFMSDLRIAFFVSFAIGIIAAIIAYLGTRKKRKENKAG